MRQPELFPICSLGQRAGNSKVASYWSTLLPSSGIDKMTVMVFEGLKDSRVVFFVRMSSISLSLNLETLRTLLDT